MLAASGGTGKTALRIAQLMACATGRELTGEQVFQQCRVLLVSQEDGEIELRRRLEAARRHYEISHEQLLDAFYFWCPLGLRLNQI
jgi:RecA-family ATPase